jgi:cytidylate kinase
MENLLHEYLERTFSAPVQALSDPCGIGPVVTISREFGCPSKLIAQILTDVLNKRAGKAPKWRTINKEVVEESARHLNLNSHDVQYLISSGNKGMIEDILSSFSQTYVSSVRLRKTLMTVIRNFARQGHVVIVGRGGAGILHGCPDTLHVRLMAPLSWRVEELSLRKHISKKEAIRLATEMDLKRSSLIEMMTGSKPDTTLFDVIYNCSTLSCEEVAGAIFGMLEARKMI